MDEQFVPSEGSRPPQGPILPPINVHRGAFLSQSVGPCSWPASSVCQLYGQPISLPDVALNLQHAHRSALQFCSSNIRGLLQKCLMLQHIYTKLAKWSQSLNSRYYNTCQQHTVHTSHRCALQETSCHQICMPVCLSVFQPRCNYTVKLTLVICLLRRTSMCLNCEQ